MGRTARRETTSRLFFRRIPQLGSAFAGHVTPTDYAIGDVTARGFVRCDVAREALATSRRSRHYHNTVSARPGLISTTWPGWRRPSSREHTQSWLWLQPARCFVLSLVCALDSWSLVVENDQKRAPRERRAAGWSRRRRSGFLGGQPREKEARCPGVVWRLVSFSGPCCCVKLFFLPAFAAPLWSSLLLLAPAS